LRPNPHPSGKGDVGGVAALENNLKNYQTIIMMTIEVLREKYRHILSSKE